MRSLLLKKELFEKTLARQKTETRRTHHLNRVNVSPDHFDLIKQGIDQGTNRKYGTFKNIPISNNTENVGNNTIKVLSKFAVNEILFLAEPHWFSKSHPISCMSGSCTMIMTWIIPPLTLKASSNPIIKRSRPC
jgi:hypothetical protein